MERIVKHKLWYTAGINFGKDDYLDGVKLREINRVVSEKDKLFVIGNLVYNLKDKPEGYLGNLINTISNLKCKNIYLIEGLSEDKQVNQILLKANLIKNISPYMIILDEAFHLLVQIFASYFPVIPYNYSGATLNLHGLLGAKDFYGLPFYFSVHYEDFHKPVSLEDTLSVSYGDHVNPYEGYIDTLRDFYNKENR